MREKRELAGEGWKQACKARSSAIRMQRLEEMWDRKAQKADTHGKDLRRDRSNLLDRIRGYHRFIDDCTYKTSEQFVRVQKSGFCLQFVSVQKSGFFCRKIWKTARRSSVRDQNPARNDPSQEIRGLCFEKRSKRGNEGSSHQGPLVREFLAFNRYFHHLL